MLMLLMLILILKLILILILVNLIICCAGRLGPLLLADLGQEGLEHLVEADLAGGIQCMLG